MSITRRLFLRNAAAGGMVAGAAVAPVAIAAAESHTPQDRFKLHLAGLKQAAMEMDPLIRSWSVVRSEDDDLAALTIYGHRRTGSYEGDGTYAVAGHETGRRHVELLPYRIDGQRAFRVSTPMERSVMTEPHLETCISRRIS